MGKIKSWLKRNLSKIGVMSTVCLSLIVPCSASGESGTMGSAITAVGTALTGVIGYMSQVTSAILSDNLWLLGMGFFVLLFIAGFVMYLFRVGRR